MSARDRTGGSVGVGIGICLLMLSILAPLMWWSPDSPPPVEGSGLSADVVPSQLAEAETAGPWEQLQQLAVAPLRPMAAPAVALQHKAARTDGPLAARLPREMAGPRVVTARLARRRPVTVAPPAAVSAVVWLPRRMDTPSLWAAWPPATALLQELNRLDDAEVRPWRERVLRQLSELEELDAATPGSATEVLATLVQLQLEGRQLLATNLSDQTRSQLSNIVYSLYRRLAVWQFAHRLGDQAQQASLTNSADSSATASPATIAQHLPHVRRHLAQQQAPAWAEYLLLQELAESDETHDALSRCMLAQRLADRLHDKDLSASQRRFLAAPVFVALESAVKRWASQSSWDLSVLDDIERAELGQPDAARRLAVRTRAMLWSDVRLVRQVGESIEAHYRNANIRVTMTREIVNRLVVDPAPSSEPFRDNILGASVAGQNAIETDLEVQLVPDSRRWHVVLYASGTIDSRSRSTKGPVTLFNRSATHYAAEKEFVLTPDRVLFGQSQSLADNSTSLRGMRTDYDTIPILGSITRSIASRQHDRQAPEARRIVQRRASSRINRQFDAEAARQLAAAERQLDKLLDPLRDLQLEPLATDMLTTEKRMTGRARLAGAGQLGAFTPRPQALTNSLASAQVHQSAVNNLLANLNFAGRSGDLREVLTVTARRLGSQNWKPAEDLRQQIFVQFADTRPVSVEMENDQVTLTLKFSELDAGGDFFWYDFDVVVKYQPVVEGLHYELSRIQRVGIRGDEIGIRGQVELRGIFSKVFAKSRTIPVIGEQLANDSRLRGMEVTQSVIANGWLGVSIGPPVFARQPQVSTRR